MKPTRQGLDGFEIILHPCLLDKSSLGNERFNTLNHHILSICDD